MAFLKNVLSQKMLNKGNYRFKDLTDLDYLREPERLLNEVFIVSIAATLFLNYFAESISMK